MPYKVESIRPDKGQPGVVADMIHGEKGRVLLAHSNIMDPFNGDCIIRICADKAEAVRRIRSHFGVTNPFRVTTKVLQEKDFDAHAKALALIYGPKLRGWIDIVLDDVNPLSLDVTKSAAELARDRRLGYANDVYAGAF